MLNMTPQDTPAAASNGLSKRKIALITGITGQVINLFVFKLININL